MFIILHSLNKTTAQWLIIKKDKILARGVFKLSPDHDKLLLTLDRLLKKYKISLAKSKGLVLLVHEATLTQIKLFTATINTLAWQYDLPVTADWSYVGRVEDDFNKISVAFKKIKKFKPLVITYQRPPEITISKKKSKFIIKK